MARRFHPLCHQSPEGDAFRALFLKQNHCFGSKDGATSQASLALHFPRSSLYPNDSCFCAGFGRPQNLDLFCGCATTFLDTHQPFPLRDDLGPDPPAINPPWSASRTEPIWVQNGKRETDEGRD